MTDHALLAHARELLYRDAKVAARYGARVSEWRAGLRAPVARSAKLISARELHAIECLVWSESECNSEQGTVDA
jgi:hypothetical protein